MTLLCSFHFCFKLKGSNQWCVIPGISNPNPDPNPGTSNLNPAESESTSFFLNPNSNPTALNPNPAIQGPRRQQGESVYFFKWGIRQDWFTKWKIVGVWSEPKVWNPDSNPNPPFFLESESGFLLSSSKSETESESSPKSPIRTSLVQTGERTQTNKQTDGQTDATKRIISRLRSR